VDVTGGAAQEGGCGTHATLGEELRAVAALLLERLGPALERARAGAGRSDPGPAEGTCASCPVCAVLALVRGERPELAARLAERASALLDALAAALEEPPGPEPAPPAPTRRVQRIRVERPEPVR
jgi:hypothetical protein